MMKKGCYVLAMMVLLTGCSMLPGGDGGSSSTTSSSTASGQGKRPAPNDSEITSSVRAALKQDDLLAGNDVDVTSDEGVVTLSGRLPNARAANRAFSVARSTDGVRRVISNLTWPSP
ncbi:MAG: BON domain-containing protein [Gammaproteobacteria bacterium]|nr:BON domain-containing protein [Gammaproteobacteria bacterium]MCP5426269.1 BON domain-containing protein [Gammaproteobacteria bacterium]